ncbi:MAG: hypothetical protein AcusKO_13240 [Acuticoccus sp.]
MTPEERQQRRQANQERRQNRQANQERRQNRQAQTPEQRQQRRDERRKAMQEMSPAERQKAREELGQRREANQQRRRANQNRQQNRQALTPEERQQRRDERRKAMQEMSPDERQKAREELRQRRQANQERRQANQERGQNRQALTPEERQQRRDDRRKAMQEMSPQERQKAREELRQRRQANQGRRQAEGGRANRQNLTQEERLRQREERRQRRLSMTDEERRARREELLRQRRGGGNSEGERGDGERRRANREAAGREERREARALARKREIREERVQEERDRELARAERRAEAMRGRRNELRRELRRTEHQRDDAERVARRRGRVLDWERAETARLRANNRNLRRADAAFFARTQPIALGPRRVYRNNGVSLVVNPYPRRLRWRAADVRAYELNNGWRERVVVRPGGVRVVTVSNRYGVPVRRYREVDNGPRVVLFNNQPSWWGPETDVVVNVRPPRVRIPRQRYVVEQSAAPVADVYDALVAEPVDEIDRSFTLNQVLANETVREYMPRVDVDTITFAFGSAYVDDGEIATLETIGAAMEEAIIENPAEVFLIEGHTDAVGSDLDNLELSDARAEAVAEILTEFFEIPPENMVTQGFGEADLKVAVEGPNRQNRRVSIRRITPLLSTDEEIAGYEGE